MHNKEDITGVELHSCRSVSRCHNRFPNFLTGQSVNPHDSRMPSTLLPLLLLLICWSAGSRAGFVQLRDGKIDYVSEDAYDFGKAMTWCGQLGGEGLRYLKPEDLVRLRSVYDSVPRSHGRTASFWVNAAHRSLRTPDGYYWGGSEDRVDASLWCPGEPDCAGAPACVVAFGNVAGNIALYTDRIDHLKRAFCVFDTRDAGRMSQLRGKLASIWPTEDREALRQILDSL